MTKQLGVELGKLAPGPTLVCRTFGAIALAILVGCSSEASSDSSGNDAGPSSDTGGPTDEGGTSDGGSASDGCTAYAKALCAMLNQCVPRYVREGTGTVDRCVTVYTARCAMTSGAPGVTATSAAWAACADAITANRCAAFNSILTECSFRGDRPSAAPCAVGAQCASGSCIMSGSPSCGTCGDADVPTKTSGPGEACGGGTACQIDLECVGGKCLEKATEVGASCATQSCSSWHSLYCDGTKHCALEPVATGSDTCGGSSSAALSCPTFMYCSGGKCAPKVDFGAACSDKRQCPDSTCLASGVCGFVDPTVCK